MSAFLYFSQDKRRHIKAENPSMRNTEVSRKLGDLWRNASEEERAPHIEKEKGEREKYKSLIAEWRKEHEEKMEEQKKAQAKAQAEHAAQLAGMYNAATANVTSNEQEQTQYNYPPGGYGDAHVMQQQPQYMGQHQHQAHASLYGYASSYPPYGSMPCKLFIVFVDIHYSVRAFTHS
jgi:HMG (high mobility group) box